jgi:hypothetical protein
VVANLSIEVTFFNRFLIDFFGGLECFGYSFANVAHFVVFLEMSGFEPRELPQQDGVLQLSHLSPYLATHLPHLATYLPDLATHLP